MEPATGIPLSQLIGRLAQSARPIGPVDRTITSIAIDSRAVSPGALFVALRGERTDGHEYARQAVERGAVALIVEDAIQIDADATLIVVPDSGRAVSQISDEFFGRPSHSLNVAGVTGTNGKTTVTHMIAAMLEAAGIRCGVIGTVGGRFGERSWPLQHTTPLAPELHELLAGMRACGAQAVAMEVSSHALALGRANDVRFEVAALTNVTRDHLDFHETLEAYAAAKRKLFDLAPIAVLNAGDALGDRWSRELRGRKRVVTYALTGSADIVPQHVDVRSHGSSFTLGGSRFDVRLPGRFNVANALCAIGVARAMQVDDAACARGLRALDRVPGRMEHVRGANIDVVVDYAHTPDALENVLRAARDFTAQRVIVVFGCGGDRDRGKRPQMGTVAASLADEIVVTSDNPRTEDPQTIVNDIVRGIPAGRASVVLDRADAIRRAVSEANENDVIVIAGKGHEQYQIVGTQSLPFDDVACAREALARREQTHA